MVEGGWFRLKGTVSSVGSVGRRARTSAYFGFTHYFGRGRILLACKSGFVPLVGIEGWKACAEDCWVSFGKVESIYSQDLKTEENTEKVQIGVVVRKLFLFCSSEVLICNPSIFVPKSHQEENRNQVKN
jgi:hypothetical protein